MSKFQIRVLDLVTKIPRGRVTTYKEVARALGKPRAYRAVANALANNPKPLEIPCHRVVKSSGEIGGYRLGKKRKADLLRSEGVAIREGKVDLRKFFVKLG